VVTTMQLMLLLPQGTPCICRSSCSSSQARTMLHGLHLHNKGFAV
jgi:hypothetical protein